MRNPTHIRLAQGISTMEFTVIPNSKRFSIDCCTDRSAACPGDLHARAHLKSAPEHNRANLELIKELSGLLGCEVRILSGLSSKRKLLAISMEKGMLVGKLSALSSIKHGSTKKQ